MDSEILILKEEVFERKKIGKFDVLIFGPTDNLFTKEFIALDNPEVRHKYINCYDLRLREQIKFPSDFNYIYHPEIMDKLMNVDILILSYIAGDFLSLESIITFFNLYFKKLEENERPICVIIFETKNDENQIFENENNYINLTLKNKINELRKYSELFGCLICGFNTNEEKFDAIIIKCINKLQKVYNNESYDLFKSKINDASNKFKCQLSIYGNRDIQIIFIKNLLKLKCNSDYKKINENYFVINYKYEENNKNMNFQIIIELMKERDYCDESQCNIYLYDPQKKDTFFLIENIIKYHISKYGAKYKKLYKIFSMRNNNCLNEESKTLSKKMGGEFDTIDLENINKQNIFESLNNLYNNILIKILEYIIKNQEMKSIGCNNDIKNKKDELKKKVDNEEYDIISMYETPFIFIDQLMNSTIKEIQNYKNGKFIFNKCPKCYNSMNIHINSRSNIIVLNCPYCNLEPKGYSIEEFTENKIKENKKLYCEKCYNCKYYNYSKKKLFCQKCNSQKKNVVTIPIYLKDFYCEKHNKFNQYYLKYSKKGICRLCLKEKYPNGYFIELFDEDNIQQLLKAKEEESKKENELLLMMEEKFNECIKELQTKFQELINSKKKLYSIKMDIINNLKIINNNYTNIINVENLDFNVGKKFEFNDKDTIEKRIKYIFNYLNNEADINNIYFDKSIQKENTNLKLKGPFEGLLTETKFKDRSFNITDICSLNENKLLCISFNDGKAKIFETTLNKDCYPLCVINEFPQFQGINSLYVSNKKDKTWSRYKEKSDIIYLCGFEAIKIIQTSDNYSSYNILFTIKESNKNLFQVIELSNNKSLLYSNEYDELEYVKFKKDLDISDNKISQKNIKNLFFNDEEFNNQILSINKISSNIINICLSENEVNLELSKKGCSFTVSNTLTLNDPVDSNKNSYCKIFKIAQTDENGESNIIVEKSYKIPKNYEILGCLSEEDNLLLMSYKINVNNFEPLICLFDLGSCQFIKTFKFHNSCYCPKLFSKMHFTPILDKEGFVICDENLNLIQYFYDKESKDMIYYVKEITTDKKMYNKPIKLMNLFNTTIILSSKNNYFILSD